MGFKGVIREVDLVAIVILSDKISFGLGPGIWVDLDLGFFKNLSGKGCFQAVLVTLFNFACWLPPQFCCDFVIC